MIPSWRWRNDSSSGKRGSSSLSITATDKSYGLSGKARLNDMWTCRFTTGALAPDKLKTRPGNSPEMPFEMCGK